jgi:capsid assembly protease
MNIPDIRFWSGTEESFAAYMAALKLASTPEVMAMYGQSDDEEDDPPRLLTKQGDVGVISINGPLVPGAPWYAQYAGITGYDEIREALIAAAQDPEIGAILLDINSGGGAVNGVMDVADLIANVDTNVKPVNTYSDGLIASAAYWMGSSARRIDIGKVAEAGSIGVLTVHKEVSKMMADMGITATVLRAGEYKALGNQFETLSDKAKAEIQGQLDQMYELFLSHVAQARGVSNEEADRKFAQGRVFIGDRAAAVGLVDGVSNFDAVLSKIQGGIDLQKSRSQYAVNFSKGPTVKTALTEQQIAAMAEGAGLGNQAETAQTNTQEGDGVAATADVNPENPDGDVAAGASTDTGAAKGAAEADKPNEVVALLQGQLASAQAQVIDLTVQLRDAKAASEAMSGTHAAMRAIAEASVDRLKIALGGSAGAAAAMNDEALLAEHATLRTQFENKFKAGGLAAVSSSAEAEKGAKAVEDPIRMARIQSTRLSK